MMNSPSDDVRNLPPSVPRVVGRCITGTDSLTQLSQGITYDTREEFVAIDEKTGEAISLSVEEKERIFTDAMQARE